MIKFEPPEPDYGGIWGLIAAPLVLAFVLYCVWPSHEKREDFHRYMQAQNP